MLGRGAGMPVSTCGKGLELCMLCFHYQKERTDKVSMMASAVPRGVNLRATRLLRRCPAVGWASSWGTDKVFLPVLSGPHSLGKGGKTAYPCP